MAHYKLEIAAGAKLGKCIVGLDESGRGPLAGPVVAAAVILDPLRLPRRLKPRLDDCKKVAAPLRQELFAALMERAIVRVGVVTPEEIDRLNILQASLEAMRRAVVELPETPDIALVDGNKAPSLAFETRTVVGGDGISLSIAAASIIAKVHRDCLMDKLALDHPGYGWETNRGYGTRAHLEAIRMLGLTPHHRRTFAPVRELLSVSV
ncbi:MAG: ribonuclease HII [Rhodovibrionaceae bacterium]|nr:ribonuclease HII [Rhodovibrionaceae bacterium]